MTDDDNLPLLVIRKPSDVARRCLALLAVVERCNGTDSDLISWAEDHGIAEYLSPEESEFFFSSQPNPEHVIAFGWRAEALAALLWALGRIPRMPPLNEQVDLFTYLVVQQAAADPAGFVSEATLRESAEIEAVENELYNQHWRVRDAQLFGRPLPRDLNADIVYERRYALSWCVGWGQEWDEVPTDT